MTWYHMSGAMVILALYTYSTIWVGIIPWLGCLPDHSPSAIIGTALIIAFIALISTFLMFYLRAALTDPGQVPASWKRNPLAESTPEDELSGMVDDERASLIENQTAPAGAQWPYCKRCKIYKPLRTHHCSQCNRCSLKMDHHCKWINNCVGFYNHKYFIQTLYVGIIGCVAALTIAILRTILHPFHLDPDDHHFSRDVVNVAIFGVSSIFLVLQTFSMGGMVLFHTYLMSKGMTHIEFNCCRGQAPGCSYSRGFGHNVTVLCGAESYLWCLPLYNPPYGLNGDNFQPVFDAQSLAEWEKNKDKVYGGVDKIFTGACGCQFCGKRK